MSNYINVPMVTSFGNDGPLKVQAIDPADPNVTVGTGFDGTATSAAVDITGGGSSASGGKATITTGAGPGFAVTGINITVAGSNYEIGQTITITIPNGVAINNSGAAIDTEIEVTAAMLDQPTNTADVISLPVDELIGISVPASADAATIFTVVSRKDEGSSPATLSTWTFTIELDAPSTGADAMVAVSEAIRKAKQAENSQPTVEWPAGVECYALTLDT
jgi:hypothetical protein